MPVESAYTFLLHSNCR